MTAGRRYCGRFAPSPTGPLHFGSLVAALGSWLDARHRGGEWLVRVENIDPPRDLPGASASQLATLAGFGLVSDRPVLQQRDRLELYRTAAERLREAGLAFPCGCSRSDLVSQGGRHRRCLAPPGLRPIALRFRVDDGCEVRFVDRVCGAQTDRLDHSAGDFVIHRADGWPAYQLAVVVDDAAQGVTDVVRGADLLASTGRQILLQRALGLPTPRYLHLPLALDAEGHKLSKSSAARPVDPADPLPALQAAWTHLGQQPQALLHAGSLQRWLNLAAARFDFRRIPWQPTAESPQDGV